MCVPSEAAVSVGVRVSYLPPDDGKPRLHPNGACVPGREKTQDARRALQTRPDGPGRWGPDLCGRAWILHTEDDAPASRKAQGCSGPVLRPPGCLLPFRVAHERRRAVFSLSQEPGFSQAKRRSLMTLSVFLIPALEAFRQLPPWALPCGKTQVMIPGHQEPVPIPRCMWPIAEAARAAVQWRNLGLGRERRAVVADTPKEGDGPRRRHPVGALTRNGVDGICLRCRSLYLATPSL